jgi:multiple sugar transport system ATP-binding protein
MSNLSIDHLYKRYGPATVLDDINLSIETGEFVVLVGPSGCGKSTLLRMIAGLDGASGGDIQIAGKLVNNLAPAERGIAMVFQSYALYPHMNVRKNMTFGLKFTGVAPAERDKRVAEAARMLRLDELLERYPRDLSGGQRQRVAIGRAIVREPAVFLFDEPLSNLDAALRVSTRVEIANLHRLLKATIVYVTHDQVEAMTLADRIVVMNKGRIEQAGKPLDLYYAPANLFVAGFIGSPAMNFFGAKVERVEDGRARVAGAGFRSLDLPAASLNVGDTLTIGVRPEHLARGTDGAFAVEGIVELVERLGESSFAHIRRADDKLFVAEVRGRDTPAPGEKTTFIAAAQDVHVFDAAGLRVPMPDKS